MDQDHAPLISICVPSYKRVQFLPELLDSILNQSFSDYELVIAEDKSPERGAITSVVEEYKPKYHGKIKYFLNHENLGYDANIRNLVDLSRGAFIFFLGNDDLLAPNALSITAEIIKSNPHVGMILKSYAWFSSAASRPDEEIYYYRNDRYFSVASDRLNIGVRRAGVLSGLILRRESCLAASTTKYDGSLYYQIYLAASVLVKYDLYYTRSILVYSRSTEAPDFGNSKTESQTYTPGFYTPKARLRMISSSLAISKDVCESAGLGFAYIAIARDYSRYIYPVIRDQLDLPLAAYWSFYTSLSRLDLGRSPLFHLSCFFFYFLGQARSDYIIAIARGLLRGRQFR